MVANVSVPWDNQVGRGKMNALANIAGTIVTVELIFLMIAVPVYIVLWLTYPRRKHGK